jgi:hypothetical protein
MIHINGIGPSLHCEEFDEIFSVLTVLTLLSGHWLLLPRKISSAVETVLYSSVQAV